MIKRKIVIYGTIFVLGVLFFLLAILNTQFQNLFTLLFFILSVVFSVIIVYEVTLIIDKKIEEVRIKIKKSKSRKIRYWLQSQEIGNPEDLFCLLGWDQRKFDMDMTSKDRVDFLKKDIKNTITNQADMKNWIDYLEMKDKKVFSNYAITIMISFSGVTLLLKEIPNLFSFIKKGVGYQTNIDKSLSIILLLEIILVVILFLYAFIMIITTENRLTKRLLILLKSVYEDNKQIK